MYAVVLAGGGGTRLYPLSSPEKPKPFLPLLGEETLLQRTVARLAPLVLPADVTVVTDIRYEGLVRDQLPESQVLCEPLGRNTAAAVALAAARISRPMSDVMLVLPADHLIEREDDFRQLLAAAEGAALGRAGTNDPLVTLGVVPSHASVEYGYLVPGPEEPVEVDGSRVRRLAAFEEKPDPRRAKALLRLPGVAWNAGVFLWTRRAIVGALAEYTRLPGLLVDAREAGELASVYPTLPSISVDYAVLEPAARDGKVMTAAMDVGWSDLGGWPSLIAALGGPAIGRVVKPGESVVAATSDLILTRDGGRLELVAGTGDVVAPTAPIAHFPNGLSIRDLVTDLIDRVQAAAAPRV